MKKVDFTIKGTKLPVIPKGLMYTTVASVKWHKTTEFTSGLHQLKSEGIATGLEGCIYASHFTTGSNHYIFHLSTIERLAEEQGMLYEKETERDWTGVRFRISAYKNSKIYDLLKDENNNYEVNGFSTYPIFTQEEVDCIFTKGILIEVKEESEIDKRTRMAETLTENIFGKDAFAPSLRNLLEDACAHERNIRKGCPMWKGVDENERLEQVKQEWSKLGEVVAVLHKQLNEKK